MSNCHIARKATNISIHLPRIQSPDLYLEIYIAYGSHRVVGGLMAHVGVPPALGLTPLAIFGLRSDQLQEQGHFVPGS